MKSKLSKLLSNYLTDRPVAYTSEVLGPSNFAGKDRLSRAKISGPASKCSEVYRRTSGAVKYGAHEQEIDESADHPYGDR